MINKKLLIGSAFATLTLIGCGSSDTTTTSSTAEGYLVDSPVINADYDCISANNQVTKQDKTQTRGAFKCQTGEHVRFRIGELILGEIDTIPADGYVFPQDLVGVPRDTGISDEKVTAMAQLLQSLDNDGNVTESITIPEEIKTQLAETEEYFAASEVPTYLESVSVVPKHIRTQTEAREHLRHTMQSILSNSQPTNNDTNHQGQGNGNHNNNQGVQTDNNLTNFDLNATPVSTLSQELKDALAYMGNEERLAYDLYTNLYNWHNEQGTEIFQLKNISSKSETKHVQTVQNLVQKYNLGADDLSNVSDPVADNTTPLENMPSGKYDVDKIQSLYDTLYSKGQISQVDALQAACIVEVTDVDDLNEYIELAKESEASDLESAFTSLRNASYNHYWAFDRALKAIGETDGCASAGTAYDHPEYPKNTNGH